VPPARHPADCEVRHAVGRSSRPERSRLVTLANNADSAEKLSLLSTEVGHQWRPRVFEHAQQALLPPTNRSAPVIVPIAPTPRYEHPGIWKDPTDAPCLRRIRGDTLPQIENDPPEKPKFTADGCAKAKRDSTAADLIRQMRRNLAGIPPGGQTITSLSMVAEPASSRRNGIRTNPECRLNSRPLPHREIQHAPDGVSHQGHRDSAEGATELIREGFPFSSQ